MDINQMTPAQLLATRDKITKLLPDISSLDLSAESISIYLNLKTLLEDSLDELEDTSPNKLATLITSVNGALKQLVTFQKELYSVQRQRAFEHAVFKVFEQGDEPLKQTFLTLLEEELEDL